MMKRLLWLVLLLATPAFAQRGPGNTPIRNLAEDCSAFGDVAADANCAGFEKRWCVNYTDHTEFACNSSGVWVAIASASGGGGGGTTIVVKSAGTSVVSAANTLNFASNLSVSDAGGGEAIVGVNNAALAPPMGSATGTLAVSHGGTGATTAAGARSNLSAAGSGVNADITSLTNLTTPLPLSEGGSGLATSSGLDDLFLLGNAAGTGVAYTAIPNCTDAGGNHLNYTAATNTLSCGNTSSGGGGSGYATIQNAGSNLTVRTVFNVATSGSGTALAAADNSGSTRTDITLTTTPTAAASVVGSGRLITSGAGLAGGGTLGGDLTLVTASTEAAFLADGGAVDLTCGAAAGGKAQVMDNGVYEWCDGATTSALRYGALADSSGNAATGDSATAFFQAGAVEVNRGGTGVQTLGTAAQVLYNKAGVVGTDSTSSSFTYDDPTDTLSVGVVTTYGAADNARYLELQANSGDVAAPTAGFVRLYGSGSSGTEVPKFRTATGGIVQLDTLTGANTLTNHTLDGNSNDIQIRRHATDCTSLTDGVSGELCYEQDADTIYVCEPTAGLCDTAAEWRSTAGGGGSGDITSVWQTASGAVNSASLSTGDSLDASAGDFLRLPIDKTIDTAGKIDVDTTTTLDQLQVFMGGAVRAFSPMRSAGAVLESLASTDDNYEFFEAPENVTIIGVSCRCRGTCSTTATFTLEDRAGNAMTITGTNPTCSTTGNSTYAAVTAGNTLVAGEGLAFDVTNSPTTGDTYTITVQYTVDPQ